MSINITKNKEEKEAVTPGIEEERPFDVSERITRNEYYILSKITTTYIQSLNKNNSVYISIDENGNQTIDEEIFRTSVMNLLSEEYIKDNKITINNLNNYVDILDEQLFFIPYF